MKMVVLSFDDGTIYDERFIGLLEKYGLKATLNLNSELNSYVWVLDNSYPILRLDLRKSKDLYKNMEVASHSTTHPYLTDCSKEELIHQVKDDVANLNKLFDQDVTSFAVPMDRCNEEIIQILKENTPIKNIRLPEYRAHDYVPKDPYHIYVNGWYDQENLFEALDEFANNELEDSMFVIAGHSYEFEVKHNWDTVEALLKHLKEDERLNVVTMKEACNRLFYK